MTSLVQVMVNGQVTIKKPQDQICSGFYIPYSMSVELVLPAAFCVKLYCLFCLVPPGPSSPSDTETQERENRRAGRTFREETETL